MDENIRFVQILDDLKEKGVVADYVQVANALGTNKAAISDIKGRRKKLSIELLRRLKISYPEVNIEWVIMGTGTPFVSTECEKQDISSIEFIDKISKQAEEIGCLKERIRQMTIEKERRVSDVSTSDIVNAI